MTPSEPMTAAFTRLQRTSFAAGALLLIICVLGSLGNAQQFFRSYLVAFLFWSGLCLGSLAVIMMQHLVHGFWGLIIRRVLESVTRTLPLVALLSIPVLIGIPRLYTWSHAPLVARDRNLQIKSGYLNSTAFIGRTVIYFAIWILMAYLLNRWSAMQDRDDGRSAVRLLSRISGPGLIIYALTVTLASVDWVMSLEPHWYSTIYSALFIVGQGLSGIAFSIAALLLILHMPGFSRTLAPTYLNDLGNMMFTFVILWAYMAFSQFLIIWAGNLPEEIIWYRHRLAGGWQFIALGLVIFHFAIPFLLLLSRDIKRRVRALAAVAIFILVMRLVDLFWVVEPSFDVTGVRVHWLDFLLPIAMGGIWMAAFLRELGRRPLLPLRDPDLPELLEGGAEH